MTKETQEIVAHIALSISDRPTPTSAEILSALNRLAEEVDRKAYARGVIAGSTHTAEIMDKVMLRMSAP